MAHVVFAPLIGREFDPFLFASVGDDENGTPLSVLSALARGDVDPWREAAGLAKMTKEAGAARLSKLIAAPTRDRNDVVWIARVALLISLLPRSGPLGVQAQPGGTPLAQKSWPSMGMALIVLVLVVLVAFASSARIWGSSDNGAKPSMPVMDETKPEALSKRVP